MKWIRLISALFVGVSAFSAHADDTLPNEVDSAVEQSAPATTITNTTRPRKAKTENKAPDYAPAQDMLLQAMSLIGVKYKWGGATPEAGLDCSGFVRYVFQNSMNIALPHNALAMAKSGSSINKDELKPGDLVFFNTLGRTFSHVGIYMGDNRFIHSPRAGKSVEITNLNQSYWTSRFNGARRYDGVGGTPVNMAALLAQAPKQSAGKSSSVAKPVCKTVTRKGKKHRVCEAPAPSRSSAVAHTKTSKNAKAAKSLSSKKTATKTSKKTTYRKPSSTKTSSKNTAAVKKSSAKKHK